MSAYYNEYDKFAAQWLRELIKAGLIAPGERAALVATSRELQPATAHKCDTNNNGDYRDRASDSFQRPHGPRDSR